VYDLAILPNYQRKGIGKKLMSTLNEYCEKNGFNEVFVQAETDDFQAVNFYRTTPISEELNATHFTYSFNKKLDV
jgi:aminoglycoside 3-N-acetyltransferase I